MPAGGWHSKESQAWRVEKGKVNNNIDKSIKQVVTNAESSNEQEKNTRTKEKLCNH